MLVLSGRVELMVMHGGVKNNYEHNVVVMNLSLCPQTADDVTLYFAEIRVHWVETKPSEIDNPRHHYQTVSQRCLCLYSRRGKIF